MPEGKKTPHWGCMQTLRAQWRRDLMVLMCVWSEKNDFSEASLTTLPDMHTENEYNLAEMCARSPLYAVYTHTWGVVQANDT